MTDLERSAGSQQTDDGNGHFNILVLEPGSNNEWKHKQYIFSISHLVGLFGREMYLQNNVAFQKHVVL